MRFFCFLIVFCSTVQLFSQNLHGGIAPFAYIYKLSPQQIRLLVEKEDYPLRSFTFSKPIDSLAIGAELDMKEMGPGYYVFARISSQKVNYRLYTYSQFGSIQAFSTGKKTWILAPNKQYSPEQIELKIDDTSIPFDPVSNSFRVDKKLYQGLVEVSSPAETRFYQLEQFLQPAKTVSYFSVNSQQIYANQKQLGKRYRKKKKLKRKLDYPEPEDYEGFLALNQPVYKPGDTVKLKGFVVNQIGKALQIPLDLYLGPYDMNLKTSSEVNHIQKLKPISPGAYTYEFILADSLVLDKSYTLVLATPDSQTLVSNDFHLEEYLLDELSWNLEVNSVLDKGDSLIVSISGTDANGLPVQDGWLSLKLEFGRLDDTLRQEGYIPYLIYETEEAIDRSGKINIHIPDSLLPDEPIMYNLKVNVSNSANEVQEFSRYIYVKPNWAKKVKTTQAEYVPTKSSPSGVRTQSFRRNDSIFFSITNLDSSPYRYELYEGNALIADATTTEDWQWYQPDDNELPYRLEYFYPGKRDRQRIVKVLPPIRNLLNISVAQPKKITPGEKVTTELTVTDAHGQPVPHVNLTALGVNTQFKSDNIPDVPYLAPLPLLQSDYYESKWQAKPEPKSESENLDRIDLARFHLSDSIYYQLAFPDSLTIHEHPVESEKAMFAPFVYKNGEQIQVRMIWLSNGLAYYSGTEARQPYAFFASPGRHHIWVRTDDAEYELSDIELKAGVKTEISIHPDYDNGRVKKKERKPELDSNEATALNRSMIKIKVKAFSDDVFIWQDDRLHFIIAGSFNSEKLIGPFREGVFNYLLTNHFGKKLKFEMGYSYRVERDQSVLSDFKNFEEGDWIPKNEKGQRFGDIAVSWHESLLSKLPFQPAVKNMQKRGSDTPARIGELTIQHAFDKKIIAAFYWRTDNSTNVYRYIRPAYFTHTMQFSDLREGQYQFVLFDEKGKLCRLNPIEIRGKQALYVKARNLEFRENDEWEEKLKYNYQTDGKGMFFPEAVSSGELSISGSIKGYPSVEVLPHTEVLLFSEDEFIVGTYTDSTGLFIFNNLKKGDYFIHFLHPDYKHKFDFFALEKDKHLDILLGIYTALSHELHAAPLVWKEALNSAHSLRFHPDKENWEDSYVAVSYAKKYSRSTDEAVFYQHTFDQQNTSFKLNKKGKVDIPPPSPYVTYGSKRYDTYDDGDFLFPVVPRKELILGVSGGPAWLMSEIRANQDWNLALDIQKNLSFNWGINLHLGYNRLHGWGMALPTQLHPNSPWGSYPATGFYPNYQTQIAYGLLEGVVKITRPKNPGEIRLWDVHLNLGLGTQTSQVKVDALNGNDLYNFDQLGNVQFLNKKELKQALYELWDGAYETEIRPWKSSFSPLVSLSPTVSFRAGRRVNLRLGYRAMWTPDQVLDGGSWRQTPHFIHQLKLGIIYRLGRTRESWWSNPMTEVYSSAQEAQEIVRRLTEDSDKDGVPDLYDKEPTTPEGLPVDSQGRSQDSDGDGYPDEEDDEPFSPKGCDVDENGVAIDSDNDGVPDCVDKNPHSPSGMYYDAKGVTVNRKLEDLSAEKLEMLLAEMRASEEEIQLERAMRNQERTRTLEMERLNLMLFRSNFRDYAYWQPNLITDANGKASFTTTFPDDITGWETHVLAINENKQSGYAKGKIQAWKPLSGRLALPSFVLEGDSASAIGRAISYEEDSVEVNSRFQINDETPTESTLQFLGSASENLPFSFADTGTYSLTYTIETASAYQDGEKREIEVLPVGVVEKKGQFLYVDKDTSLMLDFDPKDGPIHLIAQVHPLGQLLERLEYLKDYPYDCNEQAASKLIALLSERQIRQALDQAFENENQIRKLVRRLQNAQNKDGSWGWWRGNQAHVWMTAHVSRALLMAEPTNKSAQKGLVYLKNHWQDDTQQSQIALHIWLQLLESGIDDPEMEIQFISTFASKSGEISFYEQLMLTRIRQIRGLSYDPAYLQSSYHETATGGIYWGESGWQWYGHQIEMSLLAYQILRDKNPADVLLPRIRQYFLAYPHYNTAELAQMLAVIVPDMIQAGMPADLDPKLEIRYGTQVLNFAQFPNEANIPQGSSTQIQIRKSGGAPAYLTAYQTQFIRQPTAVDSLFAVRSWLEQDNKTVDSLRAGSAVDLWIELTAKKSADHLALEVPIPAGCVYGEKIQPPGEAHREYRNHMTTIFLEYLPEGTRRFRIPLEVRYAGSYTLNPAKVELMYVPVRFGRNELRRVGIR